MSDARPPTPLQICHACRAAAKAPPCAGPCGCVADGLDIRDHARQASCPRGLFPARGLGDLVAAAVASTLRLLTRGRAKPCRSCNRRRAALNRLASRLLPFGRRRG